MNYAKQIAEMLGLEIGEKFQIEDHPDLGTFWFIEDNNDGMRDLWDGNGYLNGEYCSYDSDNDILEQLLTGHFKVKKLPWKPNLKDYYFYICGYTFQPSIDHCRWVNSIADFAFFKAGNCFKTRDDAEVHMKELCEKLKEGYEKG